MSRSRPSRGGADPGSQPAVPPTGWGSGGGRRAHDRGGKGPPTIGQLTQSAGSTRRTDEETSCTS